MNNTFDAAVRAYKAGDLPVALDIALAAVGKDKAHAGMLHMLIANTQMKLGDHLNAAENFLVAANEMPQGQAEFLKYAVKLFLKLGKTDRVVEIGLKASQLNLDDGDFVVSVCESLLGAQRFDDIAMLLPSLDMHQGRHLQLAISYCRLARKPSELKVILDQRYAENPEDGFVALNWFTFGRSMLDFAVARQWAELVKNPDDPANAETILREFALSRRFWCDDEAFHARPSIDVMAVEQFGLKRNGPRRTLRPKGEKLRIGYLSADFADHATMILLYDTLIAHDRQNFEMTLFCITPAHTAKAQGKWDPILQGEIVSLRDHTDQAAVDEISRRGIDILVDLKGHTDAARPGIVNGSDAPLKVSYLGFPGSVRGVELDYAITDAVVTPDYAKPFYAEKLCRLPDTYQCNSRAKRAVPKPVKRADHGLPEERFIFASFNSAVKISPATIDIWARIMVAVPDSLFWVLCPESIQRQNFKDEFGRLGIASDRIFFADGVDYAGHISRVGLADLALDTFPYNGHTTTSDLLWAGLPVLTKKGQSFASRVTESLLSAIELCELVAENDDDFVAKAVAYAENRSLVLQLKAQLAANRDTKPLFDPVRFTRHLESAYEMMAERARAGLQPDHIDVPALPKTVHL